MCTLTALDRSGIDLLRLGAPLALLDATEGAEGGGSVTRLHCTPCRAQLVQGLSSSHFTWRLLHCRHPSRLFLWPRRGIEVLQTSQDALEVALPRIGWVTLDVATRRCRVKANARRGDQAQWVDNLFLHGWHDAILSSIG